MGTFGIVKRILLVAVIALLLAGTGWLAISALKAFADGRTEDGAALAVAAFIAGCLAAAIGLVTWLLEGVERDTAALLERKAAHPDEPWLWRREWAERRIEHLESRAGLGLVWGFALVWNIGILGAAALVHVQHGLTKEPVVALVLVPFLLAGVFLLSLAFKGTVRRFKYGPSVLELASVPGVLGGPISGQIQPPLNLPSGSEARIVLDCKDIRYVGSRSSHFLTWREEQNVVVGGAGSRIPFALDIPFDCPATTPDDPERRSRIEWRLSVLASTPGVDYFAAFDVPVFKTAASDPAKLKGAFDAEDVARAEPPPTRVRIVPLRTGGTAILYPRPGWLKWWLALFPIPAITAGLIAWLSHKQGVELVTTLGIGVGISLALLAITLLGVVTQPSRLEIHPTTLEVKRGLGPLTWTRRIPRGDIAEFTCDGYQNGPRMSFSIDAKLKSGKSYNLALALPNVDEGKWLAAQIKLLAS
jgi:hypothetical protein